MTHPASLIAALATALAVLTGCTGPATPALRPLAPSAGLGPVAPRPSVLPSAGYSREVFGRSVEGRALVLWRQGPRTAERRVLVIGVVHGDEAAGLPIALALLHTAVPATTEVVVIPDLNPDGVVRRTRQNARGVDLNRNFPYLWRPSGRRGDQQYPGTAPLSEPESKATAALVLRLRPTVTVWFHQPVGVVDESGGALPVERRFARLLGEPLRRLTRYHGSATSWQDTRFPGTTAFVVELPGRVSAALRRRAVLAVQDLER